MYPSIKKHPSIRWGTYAHRLVHRNGADGKQINPLKQMIDKMKNELAAPRPKKSCYELGIAEGEYDLPLYSPVQDGTRRMGGPCLSHLSFKLFDGAVHLTALYRSHDYGYKVPGYRVFRALRDNGGGTVTVDLINRDLRYAAPSPIWTTGDAVESLASSDA